MLTGNRFCAVTLFLAIIALLSAGFLGHLPPPTAPLSSAAEVASTYRLHGHQILIFALLNCVSATLLLPFCCGLSIAMMRMEPRSLLLAALQCVGGVFAIIGPFLTGMFLAAAAVRTDASPQVTASLNDLGVIFLELSTLPALFQGGGLAIAIFRDRSADPILPRWLAWVGLVWSILAQGGMLSVFFDTGPFSPSGFIGIFLPIVSLVVWFAAAAVALFLIKPERWRDADLSRTGDLR